MKRKAEFTGVEKRPRDEVVDKVQLLRDLGIAPSNAKGFLDSLLKRGRGVPRIA